MWRTPWGRWRRFTENSAHLRDDRGDWSKDGVNPWIIAATVMLAVFMEVLDTSVANVSLTNIAGNLSSSMAHIHFTCCSRRRAANSPEALIAVRWSSTFCHSTSMPMAVSAE